MSESPNIANTPAPTIDAEWVYETYKQQQEMNANLLRLLERLSIPQPQLQPQPQFYPQNEALRAPLNSRPKHILPQPEYTHEDPTTYPQFRGFITQKLRVDALACGDTEPDRVWYGFACLKGTASSRIFPWIDYAQKTSIPLTIQAFLAQLDIAFSDPQKAQKAITKINQIRQGRQSFREYLQEFEQTLLEAGGWGWDDIVRKGYLKAGINYKLKSLLVSQVEPTSYVEYVSLLRLTSDNLEALERTTFRNRPTSNSSTEPMDWKPTNSTFVSKEIQATRRSAGQCLKCGTLGHIARNCPNGWSLPKDARTKAKVASTAPEIEENILAESGKE